MDDPAFRYPNGAATIGPGVQKTEGQNVNLRRKELAMLFLAKMEIQFPRRVRPAWAAWRALPPAPAVNEDRNNGGSSSLIAVT